MAVKIIRSKKFYENVSIPISIIDNVELSVEALGLIAYVASKKNDWYASISEIRARFEIGDSKWRRISQELIKHNLLIHKTSNTGTLLVFNFSIFD